MKSKFARSREDTCGGYDYALVMIAQRELKLPNKFICTCIHCHAQAVTKETIQHKSECCHTKTKLTD